MFDRHVMNRNDDKECLIKRGFIVTVSLLFLHQLLHRSASRPHVLPVVAERCYFFSLLPRLLQVLKLIWWKCGCMWFTSARAFSSLSSGVF